MRAMIVAVWLLAGTMWPAAARADAIGGGIDIRVDESGWGAVDARDIEKVLHRVAAILVPEAIRTSPLRIRVSHDDGCPMVLYDRGPAGEYQVLLHASQRRWHMYAYEFGHELCHIVSNFDHAGADIARRNQWFEESLCEAASLYVLDHLDSQWRSGGSGPAGRADAEKLRTFVRELSEDGEAQPNATETIDVWLREHEASLRADPYRRAEEARVARAMLPLFIAEPAGWRTLAYMNLDRGDPDATLEAFFDHWRAAAPVGHRPFLAGLDRLLLGRDVLPPPLMMAAPERAALR